MSRVGYEFPQGVRIEALIRQRFRCAACGEDVLWLGQAAAESHCYGEGAQAHHMRMGEAPTLDNCVILCESCHYLAHFGGRYREKLVSTSFEYPHFYGRNRKP